MKAFQFTFGVLLLLGLLLFGTTGTGRAAMQIDIYGPGQNIVNMAMATPLTGPSTPATGLGAQLDQAIRDNLSFLPFMRLTDP